MAIQPIFCRMHIADGTSSLWSRAWDVIVYLLDIRRGERLQLLVHLVGQAHRKGAIASLLQMLD